MSTKNFYSLTDLERITGRSRKWLSGVVEGMRLPIYRGPKNAKLVNSEGMEQVVSYTRPTIEPRRAS